MLWDISSLFSRSEYSEISSADQYTAWGTDIASKLILYVQLTTISHINPTISLPYNEKQARRAEFLVVSMKIPHSNALKLQIRCVSNAYSHTHS